MFFIIFLFIFFLNSSFTLVYSFGKNNNSIKKIEYFQKKVYKRNPNNDNIYFQFAQKIKGSHLDIIYFLKSLSSQGKSYYKVFYNHENSIIYYQYFKSGYLVSYAEFLYKAKKKLYQITYFDSFGKQTGYDLILSHKYFSKFELDQRNFNKYFKD